MTQQQTDQRFIEFTSITYGVPVQKDNNESFSGLGPGEKITVTSTNAREAIVGNLSDGVFDNAAQAIIVHATGKDGSNQLYALHPGQLYKPDNIKDYIRKNAIQRPSLAH